MIAPAPPTDPGPEPAALTQVRPTTLAWVAGMVAFLVFVTVGVAAQLLSIAFGLWFSEVFVFLGVGFVIVRASGRDPVQYPGLPFPAWTTLLLGLALGAANFLAVVVPIQLGIDALVPASWKEMFDQAAIFKDATPLELGVLVGGVTLAAAICEEYLFRGVIQNALLEAGWEPLAAIVLTAFVFSAFHLDPIGFLARFELGLLFGYLCYRTGSIWPGALAHAANNGISSVLFLASDKTANEPTKPLQIVLVVAVGLAALVGLLALPRFFPNLLRRPQSAGPRALPLRPVWRLAAPWLVGGAVTMAAYLAADRRAVALRLVDLEYPLPSGKADKDQAALSALRAQVRAGKAPVETYEQRRHALFDQLRK